MTCIFGIVGWRNSGKTTLIEALLAEFAYRGLCVSTIKHAHHDFDIDRPGKDSYRHRAAGAREVIVTSDKRWALIHEARNEDEPSLDALLARLTPCDLVLVEGFKASRHPKIEVRRDVDAGPRLADTDATILAIATDDSALAGPHKALPLADVVLIARFICRVCDIGVQQT